MNDALKSTIAETMPKFWELSMKVITVLTPFVIAWGSWVTVQAMEHNSDREIMLENKVRSLKNADRVYYMDVMDVRLRTISDNLAEIKADLKTLK